MYFKYGSYQHPDNTVDMTQIVAQRMHSPRNRLAFTRYTLFCQGHFCVSGQSSIKTTLAAFEAAYADDWKDVGLYHDDGTKSAHWLSNKKSINGVRVVSQKYHSVNAEYATGRSFSLTFQADYLNVEDQIYSFQESIQFTGNGAPRWDLWETFAGLPEPVVSSRYTIQRLLQKGTVIGLEAPPLRPAPLLPAQYEHGERAVIDRGSAMKIGRHSNLLFPLRYQYEFSSIAPLDFYPRPDYPGK